jgi:hypothetical protein
MHYEEYHELHGKVVIAIYSKLNPDWADIYFTEGDTVSMQFPIMFLCEKLK